jgi:acyl-CoA reductase-like NAD-dependent aldehyde dehydrogenase
VVVLASERWPLVSMTLAEVLATSDVPGGVVNILTGRRSDLAVPLAAHREVDVVDLTGVADHALRVAAEQAAADGVTRVRRAEGPDAAWSEASAQSPYVIGEFCEIKTIWHPMGT